MSKLKYIDRIDAFLNGSLTDKETQTFEDELLTNSELKKEYEACLAAEKAIDVLAFQKQKESIVKEESPRQNKVFSIRKTILSIAAVFLVLVIGFSYWYAQNNYNNFAIAERNYEAPNISGIRSSDDDLDPLMKAAKAFEQQNYIEAIKLLTPISATDSIYLSSKFILGSSYYENKNFDKAIESFSIIANSNHSRKERAQWYLLLSYLSIDDLGKVNEIANNITQNEQHHFYKEAIEIQNQLNSWWRILLI